MTTGAAAVARGPGARRGARPTADTAAVGIAALVVAGLVVVPLVLLAYRSLTPSGELGLDAYRAAFADVPLLSVAWTTTVFAVAATVLGTLLGGSLAFVLVRTDLPWRRALLVLAVSPLLFPGVLQTIAWIFLAAPRSGLLAGVPGVPSAFGLGGMILVEGLRLAPLALLLLAAAMRNGDPSFEEAALVSGARRATVIRRVTLPMLRPAIVATSLLLALRCVGSFEVPALLGIPDRTWVFTSRVWLALGGSGTSEAAAASMPLLAVTLTGAVLLAYLLRQPRAREGVTGRAHRQPPISLGRFRLPLLGAVLGYLVVSVALPLAALAWMSTQPFLARPSVESLSRASVDAYVELWDDDATVDAVVRSISLGATAAVIATAIAAVVAWAALRSRSRGRHVLDTVAFMPLAVPGVVLGIALLQVVLRVPTLLYATGVALALGYVARYLPYATRFAGAGLAPLGRELEDAARVGGAGWWPTFRHIVTPLAAAAIGAAWLAVFTVAFTDVSLSLVLVSPGNEVVGVRIWSLYESGRWNELAAFGVLTNVAVVALGLAAVALARVASRRSRALD